MFPGYRLWKRGAARPPDHGRGGSSPAAFMRGLASSPVPATRSWSRAGSRFAFNVAIDPDPPAIGARRIRAADAGQEQRDVARVLTNMILEEHGLLRGTDKVERVPRRCAQAMRAVFTASTSWRGSICSPSSERTRAARSKPPAWRAYPTRSTAVRLVDAFEPRCGRIPQPVHGWGSGRRGPMPPARAACSRLDRCRRSESR